MRGAGGSKKCGVREVPKSAGGFKKCGVREVPKSMGCVSLKQACNLSQLQEQAGTGHVEVKKMALSYLSIGLCFHITLFPSVCCVVNISYT